MALNSKEQYAMATHVKSSLGSNSPSICISWACSVRV